VADEEDNVVECDIDSVVETEAGILLREADIGFVFANSASRIRVTVAVI
jgi:hypothetical protein